MIQVELARYPQTYPPHSSAKSKVTGTRTPADVSSSAESKNTGKNGQAMRSTVEYCVHSGLRVADPSHPIQLVNQTQAIIITT